MPEVRSAICLQGLGFVVIQAQVNSKARTKRSRKQAFTGCWRQHSVNLRSSICTLRAFATGIDDDVKLVILHSGIQIFLYHRIQTVNFIG